MFTLIHEGERHALRTLYAALLEWLVLLKSGGMKNVMARTAVGKRVRKPDCSRLRGYGYAYETCQNDMLSLTTSTIVSRTRYHLTTYDKLPQSLTSSVKKSEMLTHAIEYQVRSRCGSASHCRFDSRMVNMEHVLRRAAMGERVRRLEMAASQQRHLLSGGRPRNG